MARLNADGGLDDSFNPGSEAANSVTSLIVQTDGNCSSVVLAMVSPVAGITRLMQWQRRRHV